MNSGENMEVDPTSNVSEEGTNVNSDPDSDVEDAAEAELKLKAENLEQKICENSYEYDAYTELIQLYTDLCDVTRLRNARMKFSEVYPLTPSIWLSWIKDDIEISVTDEEKMYMRSLFEKAIVDYLSVDVWLEYIQFLLRDTKSDEDIQCIRGVMERAVLLCGSHVAYGSAIWGIYQKFEISLFASMKIKEEDKNNESPNENGLINQKKRIVQLYRREFMNPLLNMEDKFEEFKNWVQAEACADTLDEIQNIFGKSFEKLLELKKFEILLESNKNNEKELFKSYWKYIEYESKHEETCEDRSRIQCLFERAIADHPLESSLWFKYISFLENRVKVPEYVLSACERSVRNCSWKSQLWQQYVLKMEHLKKPNQEIIETLEKSVILVSNSVNDLRNIWLFYIHYMGRQFHALYKENNADQKQFAEQIRNLVNRACEHLAELYGFNGDRECKILLWWAKFEAEYTKDKEMFMKIWRDIMDQGFCNSTSYWLKRINMEESKFGDLKKIRKLFGKAFELVTDTPEVIAAEWLDFESLNGNMDTYGHCWKTVSARLREFEKKKSQQKFKQKHGEEVFKKPFEHKERTQKTQKFVEPRKDTPRKQESSGKRQKTDPNIAMEDKGPNKRERTVFVSNLIFSVTEQDLKNALSPAGKITEIRLNPRGFGYIVFSSQEEASNALKMDRTPLDKRPMFINTCDPDINTRKSGIRFSTGLEKNKLFVKGLPKEMEQKELEEIFKPHGALKEVRLVTLRNGFSKGIAYVEYEDEDSAARALLKTDGMVIQDKKIEVAISKPPEKRDATSLKFATPKEQQDYPKVPFIPSGKRNSKSQISLLPRALQISSTQSQPPTTSVEKMEIADSKKLTSNEDFRKMLFGDKA